MWRVSWRREVAGGGRWAVEDVRREEFGAEGEGGGGWGAARESHVRSTERLYASHQSDGEPVGLHQHTIGRVAWVVEGSHSGGVPWVGVGGHPAGSRAWGPASL